MIWVMPTRAIAAALAATAALAGTSAEAQETRYSLRADADRAGVRLGSALTSTHLDDAPHTALMRRHVNTLTFENETKWGPVHPERDRYDFSGADRVAAEAQAQGMKMRGHVLIWHVQNPAWLNELSPSRDEAIALLHDHIDTVVGHFRRRFPGLIVEWDVVNEGIDNDGTRRSNVWQRWIGDDYMDHAFRFARAAAGPRVALFYNDYFHSGMVEGAELIGGEFDDGDPFPQPTPGAQGALPCDAVVKCRAVRELVTGMVRRGVPIDGVGFQAHIPSPNPSDYRGLTAWVGELGLRWAITELDVPVPAGGGDASAQHQATAYRQAAQACIDDPACNTIVTWGLSDRYTWWRSLAGGALPDALHFRDDLSAKPAADALHDALAAAPAAGSTAGSSDLCLAGRARVGSRGVGRVRLGQTRHRLLTQAALARPIRPRVLHWCVRGSRGGVAAVLSGRGQGARVRLVLTRAPRHRARGVGPGAPVRRVRKRFPRRVPLAPGLVRSTSRSRVVIGTGRGRVRFLAVARRGLLSRPRALTRALSRGQTP